MTNESGYLTRNEAAAHAGVTLRTVTRWLTEGHLTRIRGRRGRRDATLIDPDELNHLLATVPHDDRT